MPDDTALTLSEALDCPPWEVVGRVKAAMQGRAGGWRHAECNWEIAQLREQVALLEEEVDRLVAELAVASDPRHLRRLRVQRAQQMAPSPGRYRSAILAAFHRDKEWAISEEDYLTLIARPCDECGGSVGKGIGLDRIDNRRGYHLDNVRPCCGPCNIERQRQSPPVTAHPTSGPRPRRARRST